MIQTINRDETTIVNHNFIQRLKKDIQKYEILYIYAPLGWGEDAIVSEFCKNYEGNPLIVLEDFDSECFEWKIPKSGKRVFVIPSLEKSMELGQQEKIWELLSNKRKNDVFLFAASVLVPERLLPYTVFSRFISYGIDEIRPTSEDVAAYMKNRGISLSKEELLCIEEDSQNMPLFLQMLANLLCGTNKGYCRVIKEQCIEDIYSFIDVVFFRTFSEKEQNALLKLSCFEEIDNPLISYILDIPAGQVEVLIERLLNKGSILEKTKGGWKFQSLMKSYLERAIHKYLDYEERQAEYQKAMQYLMDQENWFSAMRFAYILRDQDCLAECLEKFLAGHVDEHLFLMLEIYFQELTVDHLMKHPQLMMTGSVLETIADNREESLRYEHMLLQSIEQMEDQKEKQGLYAQLLYMYFVRPGSMSYENLESMLRLADLIKDLTAVGKTGKHFTPSYISVLHGTRDYCAYFMEGTKEQEASGHLLELIRKINDKSLNTMFQYLEAEVLYERNDLDGALDLLVKTTKEARVTGNQAMYQLCTLAMVDLLAARNQMNSKDTIMMEKLGLDESEQILFRDNCQAHRVYYSLLKNKKEKILTWLKEEAPEENERFYTIYYYQYLIKAKVYIWLEQYVRARMILQTLLEFAEEYGMDHLKAQVLILKSVIYFREGNECWKEILLPALEWGKALKFIRVFADEGAAVYELLNRFGLEEAGWAKEEYFKKLLSAAKAHMLQYPQYLKQQPQEVTEDFSTSEQNVMKLLVLGEKNAEIAQRLCVSENTVKYHLKNIYQKLQVKSRSQAIHKIREYEII